MIHVDMCHRPVRHVWFIPHMGWAHAIHVADQLGESDSYHIYQLGACDSCHRSVRRVCLMSYITWGHISKGHAIHATYQLVALNRVRDQLGACDSCHISVCRV